MTFSDVEALPPELDACPECNGKLRPLDAVAGLPGMGRPVTLDHKQGCSLYQCMTLDQVREEIPRRQEQQRKKREADKRTLFRGGPVSGTWVHRPSAVVVADRDIFLDHLEAQARSEAERSPWPPSRPLAFCGE